MTTDSKCRDAGPRMTAWLRRCASLLLGLAALHASAARAALPIEQWVAGSGAKVMFMRAANIPMLDVRVDFDAGGRFDPPAKAGLSALTQGMLAKGSEGLSETAIDEGFANVGALLGGSGDDDRVSISLRTLTSPAELDAAIDLLARILAAPQFPASVFDRERVRVLQGVRESEIRPEVIAQRAYGRLLYGTHPYGVAATSATVAAITRDDLPAFYAQHYSARRAVVSLVGDVDRQRAAAIADRLTARLPAATAESVLPAVQLPTRAAEERIPHSASQSHILIGIPAIARGDPDFFDCMVANYVLGGGGFVSRLYSEVREKRGLAYSVYSYFSPELQPGPFTIGLQTQKAQTDTALQIVRRTLAEFVASGPTAAELQGAKDNLIGGFALRIDSNAKIIDNLALIGFYNLPVDYLDTWTARVAAVTAEGAKAAFARRVPLDRLATVVVGAGPAAAAARAPVRSGGAAVATKAPDDGTSASSEPAFSSR